MSVLCDTMETLKQQIQPLDLQERIALLAWLAQDVQAATSTPSSARNFMRPRDSYARPARHQPKTPKRLG